ncbi:hypothetical protein MHO82_03310 [Vibrio sp. Of7-15]|uniref:type II secretion system protein n=1 Tax=Vibrio sp. Of7-15 TaxID=2724879 RepID=UPI001EF3AAA6|nr:hypothetical protein [Vibrio sp. Of7-15]MCG7495877.1 hypothetical protein [Vibrio sp. Of7-15]
MSISKGFTFLEMIGATAVASVLAVTAAPRFIDFAAEERAAAINGAVGVINSVAENTYNQAVMNGALPLQSQQSSDNVALAFGYPEASSSGIISAIENKSSINREGGWTYRVASTSSQRSVILTLANIDSASSQHSFDQILSSHCYVQYIQPQNNVALSYQVQSETSGC